jgi:hypothetical protein
MVWTARNQPRSLYLNVYVYRTSDPNLELCQVGTDLLNQSTFERLRGTRIDRGR